MRLCVKTWKIEREQHEKLIFKIKLTWNCSIPLYVFCRKILLDTISVYHPRRQLMMQALCTRSSFGFWAYFLFNLFSGKGTVPYKVAYETRNGDFQVIRQGKRCVGRCHLCSPIEWCASGHLDNTLHVHSVTCTNATSGCRWKLWRQIDSSLKSPGIL